MAESTLTVIALGSNLGNSLTTLESALHKLGTIPGVVMKARSRWYKTAPIGPSQPDYLNGCALLEVRLSPLELLRTLLEVETQFGRIREERWGPRTLDLDVILFGDLILDTPELQVPHPRMKERAFVLVPLAEIAPEWIDPVSQLPISELLRKVDTSGVELGDEHP